MQTLLIAVAAYLLGSVSFAVVVSKAMGLPDPHSYGSKNPGATNVLRTGNKVAAALTLIGDTGKGALAVVLAAMYTGSDPAIGYDAPIAGAMALLGHLYPVFHGFQGGKGVATAAGVFAVLAPVALITASAVFVLAVWITRYISIGSIAGAAALAIVAATGEHPLSVTLGAVIAAVLIVLRHRDNLARLKAGTERRIGLRGV